MKIAMATANFYTIPFEKTLDIIAKAGYEYIELDGYWKGGEWEIAQHLKNMTPYQVVNTVRESGLKIAAYHDLGGVIEEGHESIVSDSTHEYMALSDIPCLIFHTPHCKTNNALWWDGYKEKVIDDFQSFGKEKLVCIENLFPIPQYTMPLIDPNDMLAFVQDANIYCTIDTTHYSQCGIDIAYAASILKNKVKTLHLSDYKDGKSHVYLGNGTLNYASFYRNLSIHDLYLSTIECEIPLENDEIAIRKSVEAREFVERLVSEDR